MLYYKQKLLKSYKTVEGRRGKIGIPMVLNMYDLLPFWHTFFTNLGFEVVVTPSSTRDIYIRNLSTSYNEDTYEVDHISIDAYVLYR